MVALAKRAARLLALQRLLRARDELKLAVHDRRMAEMSDAEQRTVSAMDDTDLRGPVAIALERRLRRICAARTELIAKRESCRQEVSIRRQRERMAERIVADADVQTREELEQRELGTLLDTLTRNSPQASRKPVRTTSGKNNRLSETDGE